VSPGGVRREPESAGSGVADEAPSDRKEAQPKAFRLPAARWVVGEGQHLQPRGELDSETDHSQPELILGKPVQRKIGQPGVLTDADTVLTPGATAVAQFQISELAAAGVGDKRGQPQPVGVGEPQLRPRVRRSLRTMTRIPAGHPDRSSSPVSSATHAPSRGDSSAS